jgi:hypothetical protein
MKKVEYRLTEEDLEKIVDKALEETIKKRNQRKRTFVVFGGK